MNKLEARVKQDYKAGPIMAFSGHEYVRYEWRPVPTGCENQAIESIFLDVREVGAAVEKPVIVTADAALPVGTADAYLEKTLEEMQPERPTRRRRKSTDETKEA